MAEDSVRSIWRISIPVKGGAVSIVVLYGTESGNSEMVAEDVADALQEQGNEAIVRDMSSFDPSELIAETLYLIVCSSHGEGDLPYGAQPFFERLSAQRNNLAGLRYAMFGLGDSVYAETYSQGSEHIDHLLTELGGMRIGHYGRHDASSSDDPSELAIAWARTVLSDHSAVHELESTG